MDRSKNLKKEALVSFAIKTSGLFISFLLVPITVNFLNSERYGIWVTLQSLISWFSFFDMGLGNGMRNKLTQSLAHNDFRKAREYVSTTFFTIALVSTVLFVIIIVFSFSINWQKIFNTAISNNELFYMFIITGGFFTINFLLSIFNQIFYAFQKPSLSSLVVFVSNLIALAVILIVRFFTTNDLIIVALVFNASQVVARMIVSSIFFRKHLDMLPSTKYFSRKRIHEVMNLGVKFLFLQISVIIIFSTDNFIITHFLGPEQVTPYDISHKLMSVVTFISSTILTVLWSAFTDAYECRDKKWIERILYKLVKGMILIVFVVIILFLASPFIIRIWLGESIKIPQILVLFMGVYVLIQTWSSVFTHFLNGVGKLNLQLLLLSIGATINIPLSIVFAKWLNMGSPGVALGSICSYLPFAIVGPIQTYKIVRNMDKK